MKLRSASQEAYSPIVELRQYTLYPDTRETLIELFDREFVESQEDVGMQVIGQFRDLDRPNRFVWLRGFRDVASRAESLARFYRGPVWLAHRDAANATLIDSDDVLLLRESFPDSGIKVQGQTRPRLGTDVTSTRMVAAAICRFDAPVCEEASEHFQQMVAPAITDSGATILGVYVTEYSSNMYPALPIRAGENVLVWLTRFVDRSSFERNLVFAKLNEIWRGNGARAIAQHLLDRPTVLRLAPTSRSLV